MKPKMTKRTCLLCSLALLMFFGAACGSLPGQPSAPAPQSIEEIIKATAQAAAALTETARPTSTFTPSPTATRRGARQETDTPTPTVTFFYQLPDTPTPTPTSTFPVVGPGGGSVTTTPLPVTDWPSWQSGTVVEMPPGSGEGIGTTRRFDILVNVKVKVVRANGVKLREIPSLTVGSKKVPADTFLYLTGLMNKNKTWGWFFAEVQAPDGKLYWVGDREGESSDPTIALEIVPWLQ